MVILIRNGTVITGDEKQTRKVDLLIRDGCIVNIEENINDVQADDIYDAEDKLILPGLIDAHCHLREPGFEYKEDIETGSKSAAFGGFTTIACMPNTNPVVDNKIVLNYIRTRAREAAAVKVLPIAAVSIGQMGEELTDMGLLVRNGAAGFSDDGKPVKNAAMMKKAMELAFMFNVPVISHCEDPDLAADGAMNEGLQSLQMGLKGIPGAAEDVMVARELILAEYSGVPIHIAHVSTKGAVELIRQAKRRKVSVTAETCPHYFSITEEICAGYNTLGRVNPPLRTQDDVNAVIEGLVDGTIDMIATDHAPHHEDEKEVEFENAANGMVGFETALSLAITNLIKPGHLTYWDLVQKMCINPALLFHLQTGAIRIGWPADITIVSAEELKTIIRSELHSKSKNSPFHGMKLYGVIDSTMVDGKFVVRNRQWVGLKKEKRSE